MAVHASLLAAGSLEPDLARQLKRRRKARRYLAIEGHRALAANEAYLPSAVRSVIDRDVMSRAGDATGSLALARGRDAVPDPPPVFGEIRAQEILAAFERSDRGSTAADQSAQQPVRGDAADLPEFEEDDEDDDGDEGYLGQQLSSPVGGGGFIGRLLSRLVGSTRDRGDGGPPGADAPTHVGRASSRRASGVTVTSRPAPVAEASAAPESGGVTYPEWDARRKRYRPDWCTVIEEDPPVADGEVMEMPDGSALRRPLARLGMGVDHVRRQPQGDDIDIDAAVEEWVDTVAGSSPDGASYVESLRRRRDLSVLVLHDVSGSAAEPGPTGRPVHEEQRLAAAALVTALHDLGDRVALYAFNSQGRTAVHVMRVKGFGDGLDSEVARRLSDLAPGGYTRLGAAIRHGTTLLDEGGGTPRRLLVVVSDGFAYDHGYADRYAEADARRALAEARRRGVGCLCLSVGAGIDAVALRRVFGTAAHAAMPRSDDLPRVIGPLFRAALASAEVQRHAYQRKHRTRERLEIERSVS